MKRFLRRNKLLVGGATGVLVAAVAAYFLAGRLSTSGGPTNMGEVHKGDLIQRVTVAGTVIPRKRTVLMPPYNGYIKKIYVRVGDTVKMNDPIITVVPSLNAVGETYPMRSPFPGSVVQVNKTEGEWVDDKGDNNMLVRVDDLSQLFVAADAPEIDMVKIKVGQEVVIRASAILTRSYKGIVREISLAAREKKDWYRSNEKVEFPLRIEVMDKDDALKPGMSTLIDITAAKATDVLTLRHEFIQKTGDQYFVTLPNGKRRKIEVGLQNEEMFEIKSGVSDGEKVRQTDFQAMTGQAEAPQDD